MEPLIRLTSVVAPLPRDNVDTDAIIPAAYMRSLATDPGRGLFARWRYGHDGREDPGFVLNDPRFRGAAILLSGANFGCGSSRENAVWALRNSGFRCIIALGFSDMQALQDLFGISPAITCVVRESRDPAGGPAAVEVVDEEDEPDEAEALRRVQELLGATPVDGAEA
jgi:hypothetical protein